MWFSKTLESRPQEGLQEARARWRVFFFFFILDFPLWLHFSSTWNPPSFLLHFLASPLFTRIYHIYFQLRPWETIFLFLIIRKLSKRGFANVSVKNTKNVSISWAKWLSSLETNLGFFFFFGWEREETYLVSVHCMGFCSQSFHMFSPQILKSSY